MSSLRRIVAVGLPAAGLTAFTAIALSGAPTLAATNDQVQFPNIAATDEPTRGNAGYATPDETPGGEAPATEPTDEPTEPTAEPTDDTPTRGNPGYGTPSPTTPAPTPSASVDTVPPGVSPSTESPSPAATTPGGGVKAGALPVTGAPTGAVISAGVLLVAAGGASVWYTRRRRSA